MFGKAASFGGNVISCDGATNIAVFNIEFEQTDDFYAVEDDPLGYIGIDDLQLDGVSVATDSLDPAVVLTYDGSEDVSEWINGARVTLNNETVIPQRIQFSRKYGVYPNFESNPTILIDEDQVVTFCLAPHVDDSWDIEYVLNGETIHDFVNGIVPPNYLKNTPITSLLLRDSITEIAEFAFYGCTSLKNLTLSNALVNIDQYAFNGMFELTSVVLPEGLTTIGERAFTDAKKITSLSIPSSVNSMGDQAFRDCFLLESITVLAVVPPACTNPFYNSSGGVIPDLFSIYVPSESVAAYKAALGWSNHSSRIFAII